MRFSLNLIMKPVFNSQTLKIYSQTVNPFQENTYVLVTDGKALVVDPGFYSTEEKADFENFLAQENLQVAGCWLTHSHIDHVLGLAWLTNRYKIGFSQSEIDAQDLRAVPAYAPMYGFGAFDSPSAEAKIISEGNVLNFGQNQAKVLFLPGHSRGHLGFYFEEAGVLLGGDVLFRESIGRTDLPGGNFSTLEASIRQKLYILPDETVVVPGHMEPTTIGHEKKHNPFVGN